MPLVPTQAENRIVLAGSEAAFITTVTGTEPFNFQWFFNGEPSPGQANATLVISPAQEDDAQARLYTARWRCSLEQAIRCPKRC
jgi:hypothetical protein